MMQSVALTDSLQHDEEYVIVEVGDHDGIGAILIEEDYDDDDDDDKVVEEGSFDYCDDAYSMSSGIQNVAIENELLLDNLDEGFFSAPPPLSSILDEQYPHSREQGNNDDVGTKRSVFAEAHRQASMLASFFERETKATHSTTDVLRTEQSIHRTSYRTSPCQSETFEEEKEQHVEDEVIERSLFMHPLLYYGREDVDGSDADDEADMASSASTSTTLSTPSSNTSSESLERRHKNNNKNGGKSAVDDLHVPDIRLRNSSKPSSYAPPTIKMGGKQMVKGAAAAAAAAFSHLTLNGAKRSRKVGPLPRQQQQQQQPITIRINNKNHNFFPTATAAAAWKHNKQDDSSWTVRKSCCSMSY